MSPELIDAGKWLGGILVAVCGWLMQRNINRVETDIQSKADKEHMTREIERLEVALQDTQKSRERDRQDIERASTERFNSFENSIRDRLSSMERNVDAKLDTMGRSFDSKLDMILEFVRQARK